MEPCESLGNITCLPYYFPRSVKHVKTPKTLFAKPTSAKTWTNNIQTLPSYAKSCASNILCSNDIMPCCTIFYHSLGKLSSPGLTAISCPKTLCRVVWPCRWSCQAPGSVAPRLTACMARLNETVETNLGDQGGWLLDPEISWNFEIFSWLNCLRLKLSQSESLVLRFSGVSIEPRWAGIVARSYQVLFRPQVSDGVYCCPYCMGTRRWREFAPRDLQLRLMTQSESVRKKGRCQLCQPPSKD